MNFTRGLKVEDKFLKIFFEKARWEAALNKGCLKGIRKDVIAKLTDPKNRINMLNRILSGEYKILRPHTAKIPKDVPGEFRTVFINEPEDRLFLSIVNDMLFEFCGNMVHKKCKSYQKGIGCSNVVKEASDSIVRLSSNNPKKVIGWKADLSKYFDTVPIEYIDKAFDDAEKIVGKSVIIDIVRDYYHNDKYYDSEAKQETEHYQSLKQGCAVAAWLADVVLFNLDKKMDKLKGYYVRYSDDTLFIGKDYEKAMKLTSDELAKMKMKLNPKKVEYLTGNKWFKFLGFSIKGEKISLSRSRLDIFEKEIKERTIKKIRTGITYEKALKSVLNWLYLGDGLHSWATSVLKTINVDQDINELNKFIMDCLRATIVGRRVNMADIGGLGYCVEGYKNGCIKRGKGSKIRTNRNKVGKNLDGYFTLMCMRNNLIFSRSLFDCIVRQM